MAVSAQGAPIVGYGSSDAVMSAKDQEMIFMGFEAGFQRSFRGGPISSALAVDRVADGWPKETPIYIDLELGGGRRGDSVAKELHDQGFTRLYLATGHAPQSLAGTPWIEKVVGKEPPWA